MKEDSFAADSKLFEALEKCSLPVCCNGGCTLFRQGDPSTGIYLVQSGAVALIYARVSTDDQKADLQHAALKKAGCKKVFTDDGISVQRLIARCRMPMDLD